MGNLIQLFNYPTFNHDPNYNTEMYDTPENFNGNNTTDIEPVIINEDEILTHDHNVIHDELIKELKLKFIENEKKKNELSIKEIPITKNDIKEEKKKNESSIKEIP